MNIRKILVTGGARSGKSEFAENLCLNIPGKRTYLATAIPFDDEMKQRIKLHKKRRDPNLWHNLIEEPYNIPEILVSLNSKIDVLLLDCITIWLNNLFLKIGTDESIIFKEIEKFLKVLQGINYNIVIVSNEVGMGLVPENKLARIFRDISGKVNKKMAKIVSEFYIIFSGYALRLK